MELRQIRFALTVARLGAVRRAAATLNVDQAIVSSKTRDLEAELGVRLFERHAGGVRLTGPGQLFVDGALQALHTLEETAARVRSAGRGKSGRLEIGYPTSTDFSRTHTLLAEQRSLAPLVEVRLKDGAAPDLVADLFGRSLDVALLVEDGVIEPLDRLRLWSERLMFVVPADLPLEGAPGWSLLDDHPLLVSAREDWGFYQSRAGGDRVRLEPDVQACSREGIWALVAAGRGVAIATEGACAGLLAGVRCVPIAASSARWWVCAAWLRTNDNPALSVFLDIVRRWRTAQSP